MSYLRTLRTAAVTAVIAGTVLLPATGAFAADATPKPTATPSAPTGTAPVTPRPAPSVSPGARTATPMPRGGVAAGEQPVGSKGTSSATIAGSAAAAAALAGAGFVVVRRRAARHEG